jgi:hypothetical protein
LPIAFYRRIHAEQMSSGQARAHLPGRTALVRPLFWGGPHSLRDTPRAIATAHAPCSPCACSQAAWFSFLLVASLVFAVMVGVVDIRDFIASLHAVP